MTDEKETGQSMEQAEETPAVQIDAVVADRPEQTLMTIGSDEPLPGHNTTLHSVSIAMAQETPEQKRAKVQIKYPDNWKKEKFLKDGDIKHVAPETAAEFVRQKIGTIIQDKAE